MIEDYNYLTRVFKLVGNFPFRMNTVKEDRADNSEDVSKDNVESQDEVLQKMMVKVCINSLM